MGSELLSLLFERINHQQLGNKSLPLIAIEGQSYAGKTSACKALQEVGHGYIKEYEEYKDLSSPDHFIQLTDEQGKDDLLFYLHIEQKRFQSYKMQEAFSAIFLDRSIFSLIAYRIAIQASTDLLTWAINKIFECNFTLFPQHIVYIDIPLRLMEKRRAVAGDHLPDYFLEEIFYYRFRTFFLAIQAMHPDFITIIDGISNIKKTVMEIQRIAQNIIKVQ